MEKREAYSARLAWPELEKDFQDGALVQVWVGIERHCEAGGVVVVVSSVLVAAFRRLCVLIERQLLVLSGSGEEWDPERTKSTVVFELSAARKGTASRASPTTAPLVSLLFETRDDAAE